VDVLVTSPHYEPEAGALATHVRSFISHQPKRTVTVQIIRTSASKQRAMKVRLAEVFEVLRQRLLIPDQILILATSSSM
jgi:hypothetical protein